jgi:hypothetical protein
MLLLNNLKIMSMIKIHNLAYIYISRRFSGNYRQKTFREVVIFLQAITFQTKITTT